MRSFLFSPPLDKTLLLLLFFFSQLQRECVKAAFCLVFFECGKTQSVQRMNEAESGGGASVSIHLQAFFPAF